MPNFSKTTTTNFENDVGNYSVDSKTTDGIYSQDENKWTNQKASTWYGLYYGVGEYRAAIDAFAIWTVGQGYVPELNAHKTMLDRVDGWGEDTFLSIMRSMVATKKFNGDAYAEIIDDENDNLLNLKQLDPRRMAHITNKQGRIIRYEYEQGEKEVKKYKPEEILHFCNARILDEPHGTSITSAVEWVITTIEEARRDWRRVMHLSSVRILYVDENDTARQDKIKTELGAGIKSGNVVMLTCKPEEAKFEDLVVPPAQAWTIYLGHLEDKFYKQLGVPKVVLGGTSENTEASAKVGVISFEPVWTYEIQELEADLWNQLGIRVKFNKQPSLMGDMQRDEAKNTGQTKLELQGSQ